MSGFERDELSSLSLRLPSEHEYRSPNTGMALHLPDRRSDRDLQQCRRADASLNRLKSAFDAPDNSRNKWVCWVPLSKLGRADYAGLCNTSPHDQYHQHLVDKRDKTLARN